MKTVFTMTSTVNVPNTPLTYSSVRSVYNGQSRFEQTLNCIKTIRERSPSSKIFLYEASDISTEQEKIFRDKVDCLTLLNNQEDIRQFRYHANKSASEALQLSKIWQDAKLTDFDFIMKMSGRYELTEDFNPWYWTPQNLTKVVVKKRFTQGNRFWFGTFCFCVGKYMLPIMALNAKNCFNNLCNSYTDLEHTLFSTLHSSQLLEIETIGSRGLAAVNGEMHTH